MVDRSLRNHMHHNDISIDTVEFLFLSFIEREYVLDITVVSVWREFCFYVPEQLLATGGVTGSERKVQFTFYVISHHDVTHPS